VTDWPCKPYLEQDQTGDCSSQEDAGRLPGISGSDRLRYLVTNIPDRWSPSQKRNRTRLTGLLFIFSWNV